MMEKATQMQKKGEDVIHMEIGRPDFDTPQVIKDAAYDSIRRGNVFYTSNYGTPELRKAIADLVRADVRKPEEIARHLIGFAYASNARLAVIPMQDLLQLDGNARMNTPGTSDGNRKWCMRPDDLVKVDAAKLHALAVRTGRA